MGVASKYLRGSAAGAVGRFTTLVGGYGSLWLLTHTLTKSDYGAYVTGFTIATILALISQIGLREVTIQHVSELDVSGTDDRIRRFAGAAIGWTAILGLGAAVIVWALAPLLTVTVEDPMVVEWVRLLALLIPGMALLPITTGILRGLERIPTAILLEQIVSEVLRVSGMAVVYLFVPTPSGVVVAVGLSFYLPLVGFAAVSKGWQYLNLSAISREQFQFSSVLLLNSIGSKLMKNVDVLLLTTLASTTSTAGYDVAWKVASVLRYGEQVLSNVLQPRISKFLAEDQVDFLLAEYNFVRDVSVASTLGGLFVLLLFGRELLGLFGAYTDQYALLIVLGVGMVLNTMFGNIGQILLMGKQGRFVLLNTVINVVGNIILNAVLIVRYDAIGAAVATTITVFFLTNVLAVWQTDYAFGIDTTDWPVFAMTTVCLGVVVGSLLGYVPSAVAAASLIPVSGYLLFRNADTVLGHLRD